MSYIVNKFKGKYRILPELDLETNDFPRDSNGSIADGYDDLYISCLHGNKIYYYGHGIFVAYIPSLIRGHNVIKALDKIGFEYFDYREYDSEVEFKFKGTKMDTVAELLKARTFGAGISPFSSKNLPKARVSIPEEEIKKYRNVISEVKKEDYLTLHKFTQNFLKDVLQKTLKKQNKDFDYLTDMKHMKMARMAKEYIYTKGLWEEFLMYLKKMIFEYCQLPTT